MIIEQFLNKKAKEIDNPIRNWGVGFTAEVINEWIDLQIQVKKLAIPAVSNSVKIALLKQLEELSDYIPAEIISWVAASEKLPSVEQNGNKVLIYRIMNDSQESLAISIHDTSMVKYCNLDETWWMELPKPPCL